MSGACSRFVAATKLCYTQALSVELTYRWALLQGLLGLIVNFVGLLLFWLAAGRSPGAAAVYPLGMLAGYFVVSSAQALINENQLSFIVSTGIRMGKLSSSMLRPYPYLMTVIAQAAAQATIRFVLLTPVLLVVFTLIEPLRPVTDAFTADRVELYGLALLVGLAAGWLARLAFGLLAFDMTQTWGPELIYLAVYALASGVGYPADLLPAGVLAFVRWTPVYYMIGFPSLVLLGRIEGAAAWTGLARGAAVLVVTAVVVTLMWRRGTRKFEAIGI